MTKPRWKLRPPDDDRIFAEVIRKAGTFIWKYIQHDSLLEHQEHENLTEDEKKDAEKILDDEIKFVEQRKPGFKLFSQCVVTTFKREDNDSSLS